MMDIRLKVLEEKEKTIDNAHKIIDELRDLYSLKTNRDQTLKELKKAYLFWNADNFDMETLSPYKEADELLESENSNSEEEKGEE